MSAEIRETGVVTEVARGIVKLSGLPSCVLGQVLDFGGGGRGFIVGFTETEVLALALGEETAVSVGQTVDVRQQPLRLPVGTGMLGRVVDALGQPLDGEPAPASEAALPLFRDAAGIMERAPVSRQLSTGSRLIDTMIPLGRGQRQLLIGDRMTGKSTLALDAIVHQRQQGVLCVYCSIGQSHQKLRHALHVLREHGALPYTAVVVATASAAASEQYLAPYAAATIGEHFMAQGRDVLVVFDDLSKHAWAYRQLSLLLERPPGREAYPGDMFYVHAQLMERAGQLNAERGGGSMTFVPLCETQQGDVTGYICSNLIAMTDGQTYLSTDLFYEGIKPAVDVGLSVSRIGNKVQPGLLRWVSGGLRLELLQYRELVRLTRFAATTNDDVARRQRRGRLLRDLMVQPAHAPMAAADQAVLFYAFKRGWLERLSPEGVAFCQQGLAGRLPEFAKDALDADLVTPAVCGRLDTALEALLQPYLSATDTVSHETAQRAA